jgi:hypothetical protein
MTRSTQLALAAFIALGAFTVGARAEAPRVPDTGQAQGIVVPHALPGSASAPHTDAPQHLTSPSGAIAGEAARGVDPVNALPGARGSANAAHSDVVSPPGLVPNTGSVQGPQTGLPK